MNWTDVETAKLCQGQAFKCYSKEACRLIQSFVKQCKRLNHGLSSTFGVTRSEEGLKHWIRTTAG